MKFSSALLGITQLQLACGGINSSYSWNNDLVHMFMASLAPPLNIRLHFSPIFNVTRDAIEHNFCQFFNSSIILMGKSKKNKANICLRWCFPFQHFNPIGFLIRTLNVKCFCLFRFSFAFDKNSAMCRSRCNFISFPKQDGMENVCCCCLQSVQISTNNLFLILHQEFISVGMFSALTQFVTDANTKSSSANSNQTLEPTLGT